MLDPLHLLRPVGVVDHQAAKPDIAHAVEHQGFRRKPVTPGSSDLLVVGLDGGRDVCVNDETDVRLVDAHAEGNGCHHDDAILGQKPVLVPVPDVLIHSGVIRQCRATVRRQALCRPLRFLAREGVDNAGSSAVPVQHRVDLPCRGIPRGYADLQVWTVEAGDKNPCPTCEQPLDDILPSDSICRCRKGAEPGIREMLRQFRETTVVRAKVVAPLRDAVRLVDGKSCRTIAGEPIQHLRLHEPFRRDVEQAQPTLAQQVVGLGGIFPGRRRIESAGRHTVEAQRGHLITHQGDER